ncbi:MAG TPA: TonB-dependent receptor, partial [Marinagarivorans sp.]|nr:TonB-dependent receptor [Marinagarivorans sp.]
MVLIVRILLLCSFLTALAPQARAANTTAHAIQYFDLPAQNLAAGLIEFALQAHITLVVDDQLVAGLYGQPVNGRLSVETGLQQLLQGTDLTFSYQAQSNSYLLQKNLASPAPATTAAQTEIEEIVVLGYLTYPFRYTTVRNSQLQAGVNYFDSVRFTNVLPQQLISDQKPEDLADVLKFASGVMPADGLADTNDDIYIRGFGRAAIFFDGLRIGDTTGTKLLPAVIERVELLKGPGTLFFGQAEPGGTLNFISKKPTAESFINSEITAGTLGKKHYTLDINRPFSNLNSRLIISEYNQQTAADVQDMKRQLIAPSITTQLSERAYVEVNSLWQHNTQTAATDFKIPATNTTQDTFYQPYPERSAQFDSRFQLTNARYRFDITPNWSINLNAGHIKEKRQGVRPSSDTLTNGDVLLKQPVGEDTLIIPLGGRVAVPLNLRQSGADWTFQVGAIHSLYAEADLETNQQAALLCNGAIDTNHWQHKMTFGLEWRKQNLSKTLLAEVNDYYPGRTWRLNSYNAVLNDITARLFAANRTLGNLEPQATQLINADTSLLLTDSITLTDNWIASLGSRYSRMSGDLTYSEFSAAPSQQYPLPSFDNLSSQFGLVYKPSETHSWYFNYSEAVRANYRIDAPEAKNAQPETSSQYEIGFKSLAFDSRLLMSLGFYRIAKENISEIIPKRGALNSLNYFDQSAQGLDVDMSWQISQQWDVMAGIGYVDALVESGKQQGKTPADIAKNSASLFTHYRFNNHWSADAGLSYLGPRFGST